MKKKYIYLITIGPVQNFIAQARKTRDLAAGSRILSDLVKKSVDFLKTKGLIKEDVVFPNEEIETPSNRILVLLDTDKPQALGQDLEKHIQQRFLEKAQKTLGSVSATAKAQLEDYLKIYWLAIPYQENTYREDYHRLEKMLGGLKQCRQIKQLPETGRKCVIDGQYNVKYYRNSWREKEAYVRKRKLYNSPAEVIDYRSSRYSASQIQPGEGLSAISMFKRKYKLGKEDEAGRYPSTALIALRETLVKLENQESPDLMCLNLIKNTNEQFFYEENLQPAMFRRLTVEESNKTGQKGNKGLREMMQECQRQLALRARQHRPRLSFTKYYAILLFDVDDMGKLIGGYRKKVKEGINLLDFQQTLSKCMSEFAKSIRQIVKDKNSITVYAGGDDFLGFVNLNHLLPLMQQIHQAFTLDNKIFNPLKNFLKEGTTLSLSAAATVAHYKTPLSTVLNTTRKAQQEAKEVIDKNAFALSVLKKSGEMEKTVWKWHHKGLKTAPVLQKLLESLLKRELSNAFIVPFERLFKPMVVNKLLGTDFEEIVAVELERLMLRARVDGEVDAISTLAQKYAALYRQDDQMPFLNFTALLNIIDFISRHVNDLKLNS